MSSREHDLTVVKILSNAVILSKLHFRQLTVNE